MGYFRYSGGKLFEFWLTLSQVTMASQPALDAWYGARDWALEHPPGGGATDGWISRQDYEEKGGEYLSEHCASNAFVLMKIAKPAAARPAEPSVTALTSTGASAAVSTVTSALTPSCSAVAANVSIVTS